MDDRRLRWSEEKTERLKTLWAEGHSGGVIAALLGNFTRNSIIGKVHRLGLEGRRASVRAKPKPRADRPVDELKIAVRRWGRGQVLVEIPAAMPPVCLEEPPATRNCSLLELTARTCRWPVRGTGADTVFCGSQPVRRRPYCAYHERMAHYRGPQEKLTSGLPSPIAGQSA